MKTNQDPPDGYGYGTVLGKHKNHLVKFDAYNVTALCGVDVFLDSIIEEGHGTSRDVCDACVRKAKKFVVA